MELDYYVPGQPSKALPLPGRYHPPIPANVARAYIEAYSQPGDLILDPFAHSPEVIREAVVMGRRLIAANAHPIAVLATLGSITLPRPDGLDTLTTRLADSPKMGQTLRRHIDDLYQTRCPRCGHDVIADYFVWEHDSAGPVEKVYDCPACRTRQREPAEQADQSRLAAIEAHGFHYHYLLERLAGPYDEHRPQAQKLLDLYTPRNLYALASLSMKVETLFPKEEDRRALSFILLACLDAGSKLNASPWDQTHPLRLRPPSRFIELNVWRAFEVVWQRLRRQMATPPVALASSLEEVTRSSPATKGQAVVLPQRALDLAPHLPPGSVRLVLTALPPLDPVFYRLSFLWAGWLYGRQAAAELEPLLKRRGSEWSWYEKALGRTLAALRPALSAEGRLVFVGLSHDPSYVEAILTAASRAALSAHNIIYQPLPGHSPSDLFRGLGGEYRVTLIPRWPQERQPVDSEALSETIQDETLSAAEDVLRGRAEPLAFDWLHVAAWQRLSQTGLLGQAVAVPEEGFQPLEFVRQQVSLALKKGLGARLVGLGSQAGPDGEEPRSSHWWLAAPEVGVDSLSDRVERTVREKLSQEVWVPEGMVYQSFPGLLTPDRGLVEACLRAYGVERSPAVWQLRPEERQETWDQVSHEIVGHLVDLGCRLGYRVLVASRWDGTVWPGASTLSPRAGVKVPPWLDVLWLENSWPAHGFTLQQTVLLGFLLAQEDAFGDPGLRRYVVLPDERAELARRKVLSSPLLRQAVAQGRWDFIKFGHLDRLAKASAVGQHDLRVVIGLDPIVEQPEVQIPLF